MDAADAKIRSECMRLLSMREYSRHELLQKTALKGFNREAVAAVIDGLCAEGLQSDARYAEVYARSRMLKGYGPLAIAYELRQNGIDPDNTETVNLDALAEAIVGGWQASLRQVYRKKYGDGPARDRNEAAKRSRFLQQRGFSGAMIAEMMKKEYF